MTIEAINTSALADELLPKARAASAGRTAKSLRSGQDVTLRHTMVALTAGSEMAEHENPGEATLLVLRGSIVLSAGDESWAASADDYLEIVDARHGVRATEDSVFILTAVTH